MTLPSLAGGTLLLKHWETHGRLRHTARRTTAYSSEAAMQFVQA